jgi:DNA-binding FrmR family transcriptional regulator
MFRAAVAWSACTRKPPMPQLVNEAHRTDLLNRLKRAEGQLRGIQRMIAEDQPCLEIATQMSAVRKALDSAFVRMTMCVMQQALLDRMGAGKREKVDLDDLLGDVQALLGKMK